MPGASVDSRDGDRTVPAMPRRRANHPEAQRVLPKWVPEVVEVTEVLGDESSRRTACQRPVGRQSVHFEEGSQFPGEDEFRIVGDAERELTAAAVAAAVEGVGAKMT